MNSLKYTKALLNAQFQLSHECIQSSDIFEYKDGHSTSLFFPHFSHFESQKVH